MKKFTRAVMKWLGTSKALSVPRGFAGRLLASYYSDKGIALVSLRSQNSPEKVFDLIRQIKKETETLLSDIELYQIYAIARKVEKIKGDIAEVGVYKGGSAKLICEAAKRSIHLFDTFEGLPDLCAEDSPKEFRKGDYLSSFEKVKHYLKDYPNVYFYKGVFPLTGEAVKDKRFALVHLDADLYQSTLDCLDFFYPRINKGGVIISHDYSSSQGVKKAFDEFFKNKSEIIIEPIGTSQCLIIKT